MLVAEGAACPAGTSRVDYVFGRGQACDVQVAARDAGALLLAVFSVTVALCFMYLLSRLRANSARDTLHLSHAN